MLRDCKDDLMVALSYRSSQARDKQIEEQEPLKQGCV